MATQSPTAPSYQRAGSFSNGIGNTLDALSGKDVLITELSVGKRRVFDQRQDATVERDFVHMVLAADPSKPEQTGEYHAWSAALAERLSAIPASSLPVLARFTRVKTANGFAAWVVE